MARRSNKKSPLEDLSFEAPTLDEVEQPEPPKPQESTATRSSNVTLPVDTWDWIDTKYIEARSKGGKQFRKAAIIRAVFDVVMAADVDLTGAQSEAEIVERLRHAVVQMGD